MIQKTTLRTLVSAPFLFRHFFLLWLPRLAGAQEINYIEDVAPDFYHTCPCIESMPGAMPLSERKTSTVDNCWGACFLLDDCFSFSYDRTTNWCKTFKQGDIVHKKDSHGRTQCIFPKKAVYGETHYIFSSKRKGETYDCETLRQQGNTGDNYYTVKIRGHDVQVWCVMSETPAATYMDMSASSRWGAGASHKPPNWVVTVTYSRARIRFDSCLIVLGRTDVTFATPDFPKPSDAYAEYSKYILGGGDCGNNKGYASADLTSTPFTFGQNIYWNMIGYAGRVNSRNLGAQTFSATGYGYCGYGGVYDSAKGANFWSWLPLQLNLR